MAIGPSVRRGATGGAQGGGDDDDEQEEIGDVTRGSGSSVEGSARGAAAFKHVAAASRMMSVFRRGRV